MQENKSFLDYHCENLEHTSDPNISEQLTPASP